MAQRRVEDDRVGTLPSREQQATHAPQTLEKTATRSCTVSVTAGSLTEAMSRAAALLRRPRVEVLEIVDAGLCVDDTYLVTALLYDVPGPTSG
jgi:hypothetical protein